MKDTPVPQTRHEDLVVLRRTTALTASFFVLTTISACAVGQGGGGKQLEPSGSQEAVDPALKVDSPKNLKGITDACQLLTPEQLNQLGADEPEIEPSTNPQYQEPSCDISSDALKITIDINTEHGGMTAANSRASNFENFEATEVDGYPAAQVNAAGNLCTILTGVADDQSIEIYYAKNSGGTPEMEDPCGYANKIPAEALKNIPPA